MVSLLYKWLLLLPLLLNGASLSAPHPIFVSVIEIEHNSKDKTLEVSCKLFTDDFEKTLRSHYSGRIDLLDAAQKTAMNKLVNAYIQQHLKISADGKPCTLQFIGYEQQEEGILSYFQVNQISSVKKMTVFNNLLYEYKDQQMGIIHATVGGVRKSSKLSNPEAEVRFEW